MNRNRLIPAAAAAAALLITGGVAYAVTTSDVDSAPRASVVDDNPSPSDLTPDDSASASPTPDDSPSPSATPDVSSSPSPDDSATGAPSTGAEMGSGEAEQIALAHVGGGTVTEVEREWEHGRLEWKVEVHLDGVEHDVRVDAVSGEITRVDVDDDRDDRHDDDRDDDHDDDRHDDDHDDDEDGDRD